MDDLVEEVVGIGGRDLCLLRPRDAESLLSEEAFEHEEFLPYWAELWPSASALARAVGVRSLRGARVLELGCGLGLPSLAAAVAGGRVLATDWAPDAIAMLTRNAARNGLTIEVQAVSWTEPEALVARAPWDLVHRLRRALRAAQRRRAAPAAAPPGRRPRRDLARRPRPPRRRARSWRPPPRRSRSTPARPPRSPREPSTTSAPPKCEALRGLAP